MWLPGYQKAPHTIFLNIIHGSFEKFQNRSHISYQQAPKISCFQLLQNTHLQKLHTSANIHKAQDISRCNHVQSPVMQPLKPPEPAPLDRQGLISPFTHHKKHYWNLVHKWRVTACSLWLPTVLHASGKVPQVLFIVDFSIPRKNAGTLWLSGNFHVDDCCLLQRLYIKHQFLPPVVIFYRKFRSLSAVLIAHHWSSYIYCIFQLSTQSSLSSDEDDSPEPPAPVPHCLHFMVLQAGHLTVIHNRPPTYDATCHPKHLGLGHCLFAIHYFKHV